jgi:hypothetical protein
MFTSLNHSQSFILSEFDLYHLKRQKDLFKTDTLELRFREMNMFNGHCAPFFISLLVSYTTQLDNDPLNGTQGIITCIAFG